VGVVGVSMTDEHISAPSERRRSLRLPETGDQLQVRP
jgi:hypothetical protein